MAKQQYRVSGDLRWISSSGNAIFALANKIGSGKKLTIRSLEVNSRTSRSNVLQTNVARLARGTLTEGLAANVVPFDTDAAAWPSDVPVLLGAQFAPVTVPMRTLSLTKRLLPGGVKTWEGMAANSNGGNLWRGQPSARRGLNDTEDWVIRPGEDVGLYVSIFHCSQPMVVSLMLRVRGTPNRTYMVTEFVNAVQDNQCLIGIQNDSGSTVVEVVEWGVSEVGTQDSPYMQFVPINGIDAGSLDDARLSVPIMKMDTADPDPSAFVACVMDTPVAPFGVPSEYASQGGAASPKGFSYLGTKDFLGPVWRTLLPEFSVTGTNVAPDNKMITSGHKGSDLLARGAGIVLREGEGMALVSAAETAVIATAVAVAGWSSFEIACNFDLETPTLTVSAAVSLAGAEIRVYDLDNTPVGSLGSELGGTESNVGDTFQYNGTPGNSVWIQIMLPSYKEFGQQVIFPNADNDLFVILTRDRNQ